MPPDEPTVSPDVLSQTAGNHIPAAVRRAAARADELARAQSGVESGAESASDAPVPEPGADTGSSGPVSEPVVPPAPSQTEPAPAPAPVPPEINYEQRYRTLQGKYDAEVPRLQHELAQLRHLLGQMHQAQQPQAQPQTQPGSSEIPAEIVDEYGEDFVKVMRRVARHEVGAEMQSELAQLRSQVEQLRGGQQMTEGQVAENRLYAGLSADPEVGPHWQRLNNDQRFIDWLQDIDPFAGVTRQDLLHDAARRGDANRAAQFFRAYLHAHTVPPQRESSPPQTPPSNGAGRQTLESLAAPGRVRSSSQSNGASEKRVWTPANIAKFYNDMTHGRYKGREAEARRIEADIIAAPLENRYAP